MEKLKKLSDEDAEEKIEKTKVSKERAAVAAQRAHEIKKRRPGTKVFRTFISSKILWYELSVTRMTQKTLFQRNERTQECLPQCTQNSCKFQDSS